MQGKELVSCNKCGTEVPRSKVVIDKGTEFPELIKKAKAEGKDHIELCTDCANVMNQDNPSEENLDDNLSNVRQFL